MQGIQLVTLKVVDLPAASTTSLELLRKFSPFPVSARTCTKALYKMQPKRSVEIFPLTPFLDLHPRITSALRDLSAIDASSTSPESSARCVAYSYLRSRQGDSGVLLAWEYASTTGGALQPNTSPSCSRALSHHACTQYGPDPEPAAKPD
jgi:hypothetical protein